MTLTIFAFGLVCDNGFVNYDDDLFVTHNPGVQVGLSGAGLRWAWTDLESGLWIPLTWMSLQLDWVLFGLAAPGYHLTNLLLHLANGVLLFAVLRATTGELWCSALAAALFAVHPLRVESVAWVTERKDVLSACFGLLALAAYSAHARRPGLTRFAAVAILFALSLMAKPMLVTFPCVLLLLDYWPLGRWGRMGVPAGTASRPSPGRRAMRLVGEKLPLLALTAAACVTTLLAQRHSGSMLPYTQAHPLWQRFLHVPVRYAEYLGQTLWPMNLVPFYPIRPVPAWQVALAWCVVGGITAAAVRWRRRCPYLLVGWFWFLGTLVPFVGIVQAGGQAHADRYTYWPQMGLFIALAWGARDLVRQWRAARFLAASAAGLVLLILALLSRAQVAVWHDSFTLWEHTLAVDPGNPVAENHLGLALLSEGDAAAAVPHFEAAVRLCGGADAVACNNLGIALARLGRLEAAAASLATAQRLRPDDAAMPYHLGTTLCDLGRPAEAVPHLRRAVQLRPRQAAFHAALGYALHESGDPTAARSAYTEALRLEPDWPAADNARAWALATDPLAGHRNGVIAARLARQACQAMGPRPEFLHTLAAAYAEAGRFDDAIRTARDALAADDSAGLGDAIRSALRLYEQHRPMRQGLSADESP